ncbi:MAG: zinc-dependent metalloprotease [Bacteroidia bacterium]|nr:zinc-dependent metalloprotease [Bacteroidia bacterium]
MTKKTTLLFVQIYILSFCLLYAQSIKIICGDSLYKAYLNKQYPGFEKSYEKTLEQISIQAEQNKHFKVNNATYSINVVVHVVWKDSSENLADSIILNQIQVLNEDYNRLNADTGNLRPLFKPIAGNAGIHFNLYQIIRKHTDSLFKISLTSGTTPNGMKFDSLGGSSAIDPTHYLNIWVCKIQPLTVGMYTLGQILGYAFPPNNLSNWPSNSGAPHPGEDGVVIDYRCFGRNNPNIITIGSQTITIKGRTPTHEIGHYLGLRHIWGDGATFGNNNCTGNDGIQDTPNANNQSNFDCNTSKNTCVDTNLGWTTTDAPDLVENYMDYSSESCMNMFTQGQVSWMITTLQGPRSGLLTNILNYNLAQTTIYPNPAKNSITIQTSCNLNNTNINIQDMTGKVIYQSNVDLKDGKNTFFLPQINPGIYLLKIYNENFYSVKKITIE